MLLLSLLLCAVQETAAPAAPALAIEHVTLVSMEREELLADRTVLVRDGRITALGPAAEVSVPAEARRIDGRDRFLMPGLADMHVHVWDENDLFLFVANGVTTVRNMFGDPLHLGWRRRIEAGELVGPRIYTAGPIIDGRPPVWPGSVELVEPDEAKNVVREQKAAGYDFLKPYAKLSAEAYEALAVAGEEQGLRLMGHVPGALTIHDVLEAGQHTIEHLDGWAEAAQPGGGIRQLGFELESAAWGTVDDAKLGALAKAMAERGTWNCPTLVVLQKWAKGAEAAALLARPEMRYVTPAMKGFWDPTSPQSYLSTMPDAALEAAHAAHAPKQRAVRLLRDAGAGLLLGTDMGNPFVVAGFSLHEELVNLAAAGLSPYEALRAGTRDAARCMGASDEWGTLAVGQRADMLLLTANPLADVRNAARRVGVVLHGRWFAEEELRAELEKRAHAFEAR
jgi:amidohydrolase family protein